MAAGATAKFGLEVVDASHADPVQAVRALTRGEGAEATIDCTGAEVARVNALKAAAPARIINVASVAGLVPQSAGHPLYGASKSLVIQFSQSIALEGRPHNVYTTALCPGFTYSEFHDVNDMRAQVSRLPKWMWMDADTVARQAYDAVMRGDVDVEHRSIQVNYDDLVTEIPGRAFNRNRVYIGVTASY